MGAELRVEQTEENPLTNKMQSEPTSEMSEATAHGWVSKQWEF